MDEVQAKERWQRFVESLSNSPQLGKILEDSIFQSFQDEILTIYIPDEEKRSEAESKQGKISNKFGKKEGRFWEGDIYFVSQSVTVSDLHTLPLIENPPLGNNNTNPLQVLWYQNRFLAVDQEEAKERMTLLNTTAIAERECQEIYDRFQQRTEMLTEKQGINFIAKFPWRLRVGGNRGFRELLLPVFHPVFVIPYIPASSLKGAARAWAIN